MKYDFKYLMRVGTTRKDNLVRLADLSGLFTSCLCFIHCLTLPLLLVFLPSLILYNKMIHPVLCCMAILSTLPMLFKKTVRQQSIFFQVALASGCFLMLVILFAHDHLSFAGELALNTTGGLSLAFAHYQNLKKEKTSTARLIQRV